MVRASRSVRVQPRADRPPASAARDRSARAGGSRSAIDSSQSPSARALIAAPSPPAAAARSACNRRAAATRAEASAVPSLGAGSARSAAVTGGTSTCRSMRSISGPEMRPW